MRKIWFPDTVHKMLPACNNNSEILIGLKHIVATDGVHFTQPGYEKMAAVLHQYIKTQRCKNISAAVLSLSGSSGMSGGKPPKTFYRRGFVPPTGSCCRKQHNAAYRASHPDSDGKWKGHPVNVGQHGGQNCGHNTPGSSGGRGRALAAHPPITGDRVQWMIALSRNTNLGPVSSFQQHQPSAQATSSAPRGLCCLLLHFPFRHLWERGEPSSRPRPWLHRLLSALLPQHQP
jgi:hypothetical protein